MGKQWKQWQILFSSAAKLLQMVTAAMKLKDTCSLEGFPCGSAGKESACNERDLGSIPGLGRSPGIGKSNPLQYSCMENPMDRGACWAIVLGIKESDRTERLTPSLPSCALTSVGSTLRMPSPKQHEPAGQGHLDGGSAGPRRAWVRKGRSKSGRWGAPMGRCFKKVQQLMAPGRTRVAQFEFFLDWNSIPGHTWTLSTSRGHQGSFLCIFKQVLLQ